MNSKLLLRETKKRFLDKVDKNGPVPDFNPKLGSCWIWLGSKSGNGRGQFSFKGKPRKAHRISYYLFVGPIPRRLQLDHLCRVPDCVNPNHLEPVTNRENCKRGLNGDLKTHCDNGHSYIDSNVGIDSRGHRFCKICRHIRYKEYYSRNRQIVIKKVRDRYYSDHKETLKKRRDNYRENRT